VPDLGDPHSLLRLRRERPRHSRAAEQRDELAPFSCVDGACPARDNFACRTEVAACSAASACGGPFVLAEFVAHGETPVSELNHVNGSNINGQ
jgi:hypothetical protein